MARRLLEVGDGAGCVVALVAEERAARDDRRDGVGFLLAEERGALREVERHGRHRRPDLSAQPCGDGGMGKCSDPPHTVMRRIRPSGACSQNEVPPELEPSGKCQMYE